MISCRQVPCFLLAAFLGCSSSDGQNRSRELTSAIVPSSLLAADTVRAALAWVFRIDDCLGCDAPAPLFRRVQRLYPTSIEIKPLLIGSTDTSAANAFFVRERVVNASVRFVNQDDMRLFARESLPRLYLVDRDRIVESWGRGTEQSSFTVDSLVLAAIANLVGGSDR